MKRDLPQPHPPIIRAITRPTVQLAVSLLALGVIVFYGAALFLYPGTCGVWASRGEITGLDSSAERAGLQLGDRILAIDRRPYDRWFLTPPFRTGLQPGDTVVFEVQRGEQRLAISVLATPSAADPGFAPLVGQFILSVFLWGCGLVLCLFAPAGDPRPRLIGLFWLVMGAAIAAGGPGQGFSFWWATTATRVAWSLLVLLGVAAHLYFPRPILSPRARGRVITLLSILALFLAALTLLDDGYSKPLLGRSLGSHLPVYLAAAVSILANLGLLLRSRFLEGDPDIRRQTGIVLLGSALGFGPFLILTFLPSIFQTGYLPASVTLPFLALIPLSYAYVIYQRKLLRVDFLINRMVLFFIVFLGVLFTAFVILAVIVRFVDVPAPLLGAVAAATLALPTALALDKAQGYVNRILYGTHYDHATVAGTLSERLARALDWEALTQLLTHDLAQQMGIRQAALFPAGSLDDEERRVFLAARGPLHAPDLWASLSPEGRQGFAWGLLFAPIVFDEHLYGLLVLGGRTAGEVYSGRDIKIIATVAHQAALAADHIHLVETLRGLSQQLVRAGENERRQVARDLHDSVLQNLFLIKQQVRREPGLPAQVDEIIATLRRTIKAQRPPGLERGLAAALSDLVDDMRRLVAAGGVSIGWSKEGEDISIPDELATAIYRIAQEAISNAIRHAQAYLVQVTLSCETGRVVLTVEDDGVGMPLDVSGEGHYGLVGMRERARMAGGCLQIASTPGRGVTITLEVPL